MQPFGVGAGEIEVGGEPDEGVGFARGDVPVEQGLVEQGEVGVGHHGLRHAGEPVEDASQEMGVAFSGDAAPYPGDPRFGEGGPGGPRRGGEQGVPRGSGAGQSEVVAQQSGGGAGVDECVVVAVERDVGHGAAACEGARSVGEEAYGLGHGAYAEVVPERRGHAEALELARQEAQVEGEVVGDRDASAKQDGQGAGDVDEGGGVADVGGGDAVDVLRAEVASGINEGAPFTGDAAGGVEMHDADLDHPVVQGGVQPRGLHVDDRVTG